MLTLEEISFSQILYEIPTPSAIPVPKQEKKA